MLEGKTLTKTLDVEAKQHEVLGLDLGEGIPRHQLFLGVAIVFVWVGLLFLVFGAPTPKTVMIYILPPILILVIGTQPYEFQPRRRLLTQWSLKSRFIAKGSRAIIRSGARPPTRHDSIPLRDRVTVDQLRQLFIPGAKRIELNPAISDHTHTRVGSLILTNRRAVKLVSSTAAKELSKK